MDARTATRILAAGRVVIGGAYVAAPQAAAPRWIGSDGDRPSTHVFSAAFGARDAALGLGALSALRSGGGVRPWVLAGMLGDAADLAATLRNRDHLPDAAVAGVAALATAALVSGAWALLALD